MAFKPIRFANVGVILSASIGIKDAVRVAFEKHTVKKIYYAIVKGRPRVVVGQWNQKLKQSNQTSKYKSPPKLAKTLYKLSAISSKNPQLSCLSLEPVTGRTHQLRIHCSDNRLPIIGDQTYGDFKYNRQIKQSFGVNRLCLHSEAQPSPTIEGDSTNLRRNQQCLKPSNN